jgi:3-oxoacyl-[acyl-carrier-protein] synthase-3
VAFLTIENVSIRAIASCVPKHIERNSEYEHISKEERELFIKTTGIKERRVASPDVTCSDLCLTAAKNIVGTIVQPEEIDVLIFVSQSPDYFLPATAIILQNKLNLKKDCIAFDVNLGCSGYVYGLSIAGNLLQSGQLKKALLIVGDKSTVSTSYTDKSAYPLFGDAGTATLLEYNIHSKPWHFNLQSDGSGKDSIIIEHGHSRHPYNGSSDIETEIEPGIMRTKKHLALNGLDIFNFALKEVSPNINALLEKNNIAKDQIDFFIFHQANKLINESVRKKLKIEADKTPYSIDVFGNTSSASIPLTMCYKLKEELKSKHLTLLLCGFGVGYSWGSVKLETENVHTSITEYDRP